MILKSSLNIGKRDKVVQTLNIIPTNTFVTCSKEGVSNNSILDGELICVNNNYYFFNFIEFISLISFE